MAPTIASPLTWTLRFKYHKKTTLLHVDPLQSFTSIKAELLRALHQTHPDGEISSGVSIPSDPSEVLLAQPNDVHDHAQGWKRIQPEQDEEEEQSTPGRQKTKGRSAYSQDSPTAAGLKDGGMVAYKFQSDETNKDDVDEALGLDEEDDDWDVIIPNYDDAAEPDTEAATIPP